MLAPALRNAHDERTAAETFHRHQAENQAESARLAIRIAFATIYGRSRGTRKIASPDPFPSRRNLRSGNRAWLTRRSELVPLKIIPDTSLTGMTERRRRRRRRRRRAASDDRRRGADRPSSRNSSSGSHRQEEIGHGGAGGAVAAVAAHTTPGLLFLGGRSTVHLPGRDRRHKREAF